jgi:hypothetical protein
MNTKTMLMVVMLIACFCFVTFSSCEDDDDDGDGNGGSGACDRQDEVCDECNTADKRDICAAFYEDCDGNDACCEAGEDEMIILCEV